MINVDRTKRPARLLLRSLLTPVVLAVLIAIAIYQHQQNRQLQSRLEALSLQAEHLKASDDLTAAKLDILWRAVSDEPILSVDDFLAEKKAVKTGGSPGTTSVE